LLGIARHRYYDSFLADLFGPSLGSREPILGRRIRRTTQKRDDQQIPDRLPFGKSGMNPQSIAWLKVWYFRDRQRLTGARDCHFNAGTS